MSIESYQSELSRPIKIKALKQEPYLIETSPAEREALAKRFMLSDLLELRAEVSLVPKGTDIFARGKMTAKWLQACAVSGEDFEVEAKEVLHFRFVQPYPNVPEEEIELEADQLDEIEFEGDNFDLGEAVAQSLGLIIDPYATGPNADTVRQAKGIQVEGEQDGPMAELLAGLKRD